MAVKNKSVRYKGSEIIRSAGGTERDILTVVLDKNKAYTASEVEKSVKEFLIKEAGK